MLPFRRAVGWTTLLAALTTAGIGSAQNPDEAYSSAQRSIQGFENSLSTVQGAIAHAVRPPRTPQQRLADGDLLLRARDFDRAAVIFSQITETAPNNGPVYAEALYLLGETYFHSDQLLSAKRVFTRIAGDSRTQRLSPYKSRALARLTDIALRTRDLDSLDDLHRRLGTSVAGSVDPILAYARGRVLLAKRDSTGARSALQSVPSNSHYYHQACYLLGVITLREALASIESLPEADQKNPRTLAIHYTNAIEAFRMVTQLPPDTSSHRHVVDLGWLAVGRLLYETDQLTSAVDAYGHVGRHSREFGNALFETAAVHVQMGDSLRAQRALEVLAVVDPDGPQAAEAGLLRGDLELRTKQFDKSLATFESIRHQFEPMSERVAAFLASTSDPAVFYDQLIEDQLTVTDAGPQMSPLAVRWAREADQGQEAFSVVNEVVRTRTLLRHGQDLDTKLHAVMNSPARSKAFPELRAGQQVALGSIHGILKARVVLAQALDKQEGPNLTGEIATVRQHRRALERKALALPTSLSSFQQRENMAENQWNRLAQKVHQLEIQADTLQSVVNALQRVLQDGASRGVVRDPATAARFNDELAAHEAEIAAFRETISLLRDQANQGRIASGFDDTSVFDDANTLAMYKQLLATEVELASRGATGPAAAAYAIRIAPLLRTADAVERKYEASLAEINRLVDQRAAAVLAAIAAEQAKLQGYGGQLQLLDQEARSVVGDIAMRNFGIVRERLRSIVMRADVGITEEAWEAREDQALTVRRLQSERAQTERSLNEEMREVLDDATDE